MENNNLPVKKKQNTLAVFFRNTIEIIKSKIDKSFILTEESPDSLKRNRELIIRTLKRNSIYLDSVPQDFLMEELKQGTLPENGIILTAFNNGYFMSQNSPRILLGLEAKRAILEYFKIKKLTGNNLAFNILDDRLLQDSEFRDTITEMAIEEGYKLESLSPKFLKENSQLALEHYKNLMKSKSDVFNKDNSRIECDTIMNPKLIRNAEFLKSYIELLKANGMDEDIILDSLIKNERNANAIREDRAIVQNLFDSLGPSNVSAFFDKVFDGNKQEIDNVLSNQEGLHGKMLKLSKLYQYDNFILQSLDGRLLDDKFDSIPEYKMPIISLDQYFQKYLIGLNDFEYKLYTKMSEYVEARSVRWTSFDRNIIENLQNPEYKDLINDIYIQAMNGNKISQTDMENLTFLLAKSNTINPNVFNITTKNELEHYNEISELVCDAVINNPNLDDEQIRSKLGKYIGRFEKLSETDRVKLALLEKYFNIDLNEAEKLARNFGGDIENVDLRYLTGFQSGIIEQQRAIKNIFECDDIDTLKEVAELDVRVRTCIPMSTFLIEETREVFGDIYKRDLYMPEQSSKIAEVEFDGENIEVFDAGIDLKMMVKTVNGNVNGRFTDIWNRLTSNVGFGGNRNLRYKTCMSYMTDENLLQGYGDDQVILGFGKSTRGFSFEKMYTHDNQTPMGDIIEGELGNSSFQTPDSLETSTSMLYNEIVMNTVSVDHDGKMGKMMPDYIVYIKDKTEMGVNDFEDDNRWQKSKKMAKEFGIPIVVVDREKIMESEKSKIESMSSSVTEKSNVRSISRFIGKIKHFMMRYGDESIKEFAQENRLKQLEEVVRQKQEMYRIPLRPQSDIGQKRQVMSNSEIITRITRIEEEGRNR